jgi:membrane dipeptidase
MIAQLAERDGVIGVVPYNAFLTPRYHPGDPKYVTSLVTIVDVIDHICQVTGSARHVGLGTDFDGGLGVEHVPAGIDTIADLQKLVTPLQERGFTAEQIAAIFHGNWLRVLMAGLPE